MFLKLIEKIAINKMLIKINFINSLITFARQSSV